MVIFRVTQSLENQSCVSKKKGFVYVCVWVCEIYEALQMLLMLCIDNCWKLSCMLNQIYAPTSHQILSVSALLSSENCPGLATTVLLLEVVPVDEIKEQLRKKCLLWGSSSSLKWFQKGFPVKSPVWKIPCIFCTISDTLNNLPSPHHWSEESTYNSQTKFLNSLQSEATTFSKPLFPGYLGNAYL